MGLSPMMQQYLEIHERVPDAILMFRLGDFYEMFFDDALTASKALEITLTGKDCGLEERAPMCGVPWRTVDHYVAALIEKGFKVAICEQMEDPATAKGMVTRDLVKVISPGTFSDTDHLTAKKNNYLMSLFMEKNRVGIAYTDISTGDFYVTEIHGKSASLTTRLMNEISRIEPAEILVDTNIYEMPGFVAKIESRFPTRVTSYNKKVWHHKKAGDRLVKQFKVFSLLSLGLEGLDSAVRAAGALLCYLDETQMTEMEHIHHLTCYKPEDYMVLDVATRRNLELTQTLRSGEKRGSLLWVLDRTSTAMGGRMLRRFIETPLLSKSEIVRRQTYIEELSTQPGMLAQLKNLFAKIYDLERICGKITFGSLNPRDLLALKQSIGCCGEIADYFLASGLPTWQERFEGLDRLSDVYDLIDRSISEEAPLAVKDGGVIKDGYNPEVDTYREAAANGENWLLELEKKERELTGIKGLSIKFNKNFNYYIEVRNSQLSLVPDRYIRKQTLTNAERFFTPELKEIESKILGSAGALLRIEAELFNEIRTMLRAETERIQAVARMIAESEVFYALTVVARENHYVRPEITENGDLEIIDGRHPVVEALIGHDHYIPNDCQMTSKDGTRMMLITGPNMAGKSTYIRQVAVITLMAQIGSFVPASAAKISIVDRIFTRIGASDDLATGQSTFMIEMTEVSNILNNATADSLVILDEIGRGTSTFDGVAIAQAVAEYLWDTDMIGAKTLFATHYHELTELENVCDGIKNYSISVAETADGVVFLRKIKPGAIDQSYGIEVAKLAGFPRKVSRRAEKILKELEKGQNKKGDIPSFDTNQMNFFNIGTPEPVLSPEEAETLARIRNLNVDEMTPMEAMIALHQLNKKLTG